MSVARILAIAGSDSGGGAGIQADIRTITLLGGHAMTAITAITAQNTLGVSGVEPVPVQMVLAQIDAVADDIGIDAVKIGMLGSAGLVDALAERLARLAAPIVFDPVMVATSGATLADDETVGAFRRLMTGAALVTPNLPELARLTATQPATADEMERAAQGLARDVGCAVLAKGGHLPGPSVTDILVAPGREVRRWSDERIDTEHSHGTGCTLSSAIATGLGQGLGLRDAVARARDFVRAALAAAPGLGRGRGPMGAPGIAGFGL